MENRFEIFNASKHSTHTEQDLIQLAEARKRADLRECLKNANPDDHVSADILARTLIRQGITFDEATLNERILSSLLENAKVNEPESLKNLCRELIEQGYGVDNGLIRYDDVIVLNPIKIEPSVQGQLPGRGWAFIWELDRDCENLNWLRGAHISVDGKLYRVQSIENAPRQPVIGDKLTLLCSAIKIDK